MTAETLYNLNYALTAPGTAIFSPDKKYRYVLTREWGKGDRIINWLMLNPSTADENVLDPTVRKCVKWSVLWGYDKLIITNLFAYRSTDSKQLYKVEDPIGPDNNLHIEQTFRMCNNGLVVAAWGANGQYKSRNIDILNLSATTGVQLHYLRLTPSTSQPQHPLYLPNNIEPTLWRNCNAGSINDIQSR